MTDDKLGAGAGNDERSPGLMQLIVGFFVILIVVGLSDAKASPLTIILGFLAVWFAWLPCLLRQASLCSPGWRKTYYVWAIVPLLVSVGGGINVMVNRPQ
jgi:hypothetical protein